MKHSSFLLLLIGLAALPCRAQVSFQEIEPNEDGTPSTGGSGIAGNDFDATGNAAANALFRGPNNIGLGDTIIQGSLSFPGDKDVFAITNPHSFAMQLRLDIYDAAAGLDVPCTTIDTGLNLRTATASLLASNDDRSGTADRCSGLSYSLPAGATVFAHVVEFGDNSAIPAYFLRVRATTDAPVALIELKGNSTAILNGSTTPAAANYTLFPAVKTEGGQASRTFSILNTGNTTLGLVYIAVIDWNALTFN